MLTSQQLNDLREEKSLASRIRESEVFSSYKIPEQLSPKLSNSDDIPLLLCSPNESFNPFKCPNTANVFECQKEIDIPKTPKMLEETEKDYGLTIFEEKADIFRVALKSDEILDTLVSCKLSVAQRWDLEFLALEIYQEFFVKNSANDYETTAVLLASYELAAKFCNVQLDQSSYGQILNNFESNRVHKAISDTERIVFDSEIEESWVFLTDLFELFDLSRISEFSVETCEIEDNYKSTEFSLVETPRNSELHEQVHFSLQEVTDYYAMHENIYETLPELKSVASGEGFELQNFIMFKLFARVLCYLAAFDMIVLRRKEEVAQQAMKCTLALLTNEYFQDERCISEYSLDSMIGCMLKRKRVSIEIENEIFIDCYEYIENNTELQLLKQLLGKERANILEMTMCELEVQILDTVDVITSYFVVHKTHELFCKEPGSFIYEVSSLKRQFTFETDSYEYEELSANLRENEEILKESMKVEIYKELDGLMMKYSVLDGDIFMNSSYL